MKFWGQVFMPPAFVLAFFEHAKHCFMSQALRTLKSWHVEVLCVAHSLTPQPKPKMGDVLPETFKTFSEFKGLHFGAKGYKGSWPKARGWLIGSW
eukprot:1138762-Pelagomonas_calceolata.AAC.2